MAALGSWSGWLGVGGGRQSTGKLGAVNILEVLRIEEPVDIKENQNLITHAGKALDGSAGGASHHVEGWLDGIGGHAEHAGHGVDRAAHRAAANVEHDRAGFGVDDASLNAEEHPQVDNRDDGAAEVAHPLNVVRNLRDSRDATGDHDLLDSLDAEDVPLPGKLEADELPCSGAGLGVNLRLRMWGGVHSLIK